MSGGRAWAEAEDRISCNTHLDARRLVQAVLLHVDDLARLAVDAPRVLAVRVLRLKKAKRRPNERIYKARHRRPRTLSSVRTRIAFPPLFWTRVRGMTSIASATARNGHPSTPVTLLAFCCSPTLIAISVAPPPGAVMPRGFAPAPLASKL